MQNKSDSKKAWFGWFLCGLAALFYCYEYLLRISPSVMSNELMQYYALSATSFGNLFAIYYYIYTPMQLPVGLMLDRYGARLLLTLATLICAIGTFLFASSQDLLMAQIGRLMVGFGSAFAFVGVLKVASIWLPPSRFGLIAGLTTTLGMIGAMFGDYIMAMLVQKIGWRYTVFGSASIGLILASFLWYYISNHKSKTTSIEKQASEPSMTFKTLVFNSLMLLKKPHMWLIAFIGGVLYTSLSVFGELWGMPYLQQAKGYSSQDSAILISMVFLGWALGGPLVGYVSDHLNNRRMPLWLGSFLGAVVISIVIYVNGLSFITMAVFLFLFGVFSSAENLTFAIAKESSMPSLAGSAIALTNMFVMLAGAILQPMVGKMLDFNWDGTTINNINHYNNSNFQMALMIIPITFLLSAGLSLFLKKSYSEADQASLRPFKEIETLVLTVSN